MVFKTYFLGIILWWNEKEYYLLKQLQLLIIIKGKYRKYKVTSMYFSIYYFLKLINKYKTFTTKNICFDDKYLPVGHDFDAILPLLEEGRILEDSVNNTTTMSRGVRVHGSEKHDIVKIL